MGWVGAGVGGGTCELTYIWVQASENAEGHLDSVLII
jgi:hypothetical protein